MSEAFEDPRVPMRRQQRLSAEELVERHQTLPSVDRGLMGHEADEFFGSEDRVGDDDPWDADRG